jgi:hypothetical protein
MNYASAEAREHHLARMRASWQRRMADPAQREANAARQRKRWPNPEPLWRALLAGRRYDAGSPV